MGLSGWDSALSGGDWLHTSHSNGHFYIRANRCNAGGGVLENSCNAASANCNIEVYVGGLASVPPSPPAAKSCMEHLNNGATWSGDYLITVSGTTIKVYCDMRHEGGGWTRVARGKGGNNAGWLTQGELNVNNDKSPKDSAKSYKLSDTMINAIPKRAYRVKGPTPPSPSPPLLIYPDTRTTPVGSTHPCTRSPCLTVHRSFSE